MNNKRLRILIPLVILLIVSLIIIWKQFPPSSEIVPQDITEDNKGETTVHKKILYVASYSLEEEWSSAIRSGIESVLKPEKGIEFMVVSMDTMGMTASDTHKIKAAALEVKQLIESWRPDLVITSDDNAAKYLIVPYFLGGDLPFVFCGVNRDASKYGFPAKNVTGMVEVYLADQLVEYLTPFAKGPKIGSIRGDTMTNHLEAEYFEEQVGREITTLFVDNIEDWKTGFIELQNQVDMVLLGDIDAVKENDESRDAIKNFMLNNTKVPTGRWDEPYKDDALITLGVFPREQGEYAAGAALLILDGKSPLDIPIARNKRAEPFLNMKLAKNLGIIFPMELIGSAKFVEED